MLKSVVCQLGCLAFKSAEKTYVLVNQTAKSLGVFEALFRHGLEHFEFQGDHFTRDLDKLSVALHLIECLMQVNDHQEEGPVLFGPAFSIIS